eukprot:COSAG02_NODE_32821_length_510_cov_0.566910_1_plen_112_part_10
MGVSWCIFKQRLFTEEHALLERGEGSFICRRQHICFSPHDKVHLSTNLTREEELQRQLSEAEAAQIVAEELARRRDWLQKVPIFEPIVGDVEGVAFLNAGERSMVSVVCQEL